MKSRPGRGACLVILATLLVQLTLPATGWAQGSSPVDEGSSPGGDVVTHRNNSVVIATFEATNTHVVLKPDESAARPHPVYTSSGEEAPCAEWGFGPSDNDSAAEDDGEASESELLSAIVALDDDSPSDGDDDNGNPAARQNKIKAAAAQVIDIQAVFDIFTSELPVLDDSYTHSDTTNDEVCVLRYSCGSERVDDIIAGHIEAEPDGVFAEYVTVVARTLVAGGPTSEGIDFDSGNTDDVQSVANSLAQSGWEDSPGDLAMPVFSYCRRGAGGTIEADVDAYAPTLGWSTTVEDEYDLPAMQAIIDDAIWRELDARPPQMETIPPIEKGFTYVNLPMWLWLEDPLEFTSFYSESEFQTIRMTGQATLEHVTWNIGDAEFECTVDEMKPFIHGTNSILETTPDCNHMFLKTTDYTMTATATYKIEQRVQRRDRGAPWPDVAWVPHPTTPTAEISSTTPPMSVHEILALNVKPGITDAEIAAALAEE